MALPYTNQIYQGGGPQQQQQQYGPYGGQQQYPPSGAFQQQYPQTYPQAYPQTYPQTYPPAGQQQYPQAYSYGGQPQNNQTYGYGPPYQGPPNFAYGPQQYSDNTAGDDQSRFLFTSKSIRLAFIRKVYAILSVQIIFTIALMSTIIFVEPVKMWIQPRRYLVWVAIILTFVLMLVIGCCTKPRRTFPLNVILLAVFTLAEAFLLGVISANRDTRYVLYSAGITLAIVVGITIFAFQTKIDFTYFSGAIIILAILFLVFGILVIIIRSKILNLVYCCIGVLVFSFFLLVDTQLMLGGSHSYSISPEDYVFAALNLYVDIVQIFLMVLGIFSNSD